MPYTVNSKNLPANVQKMDAAGKKKWVATFNSALEQYGNESKAFKVANGTAKKKEIVLGEKGLVPSLWDVDERQVSKTTAEYNAFGANGGEGCATCQFFISPDSCLVVAGDISPTGMSKFFTPEEEYVMEPIPVSIVEAKKEEAGDSILARFTKFVKSLVSTEPIQVRPFRIEKSADGYRVFTIYTNNFQDNHNQILSEAAHKEYVQWADQTKLYPEFHLWHGGPLSRFGQADFVDYVDGFMVASGPVDKDKEHIAEALKEQEDQLAVSHGFYGLMEKDVYGIYRTFEISPLPLGKEANKWTAFNLVNKENLMPFSDAKKAWLKDVAKYDDAKIGEMEASISSLGKSLKAAGVEWKEEAITGLPPTPEAAAAAAATTDTAVTAEGNGLLINAVAELTKAVAGISQLVQKQQETFTTEIASLKTAQTKTADQVVEDALTAKIASGPAGGFRASQSGVTAQPATKEDDTAKDASWFFNTVMAPLTDPAAMTAAASAAAATAAVEGAQANGAK